MIYKKVGPTPSKDFSKKRSVSQVCPDARVCVHHGALYTCMCSVCPLQNRASDSLVVELQMLVSSSMSALRTEPSLSARTDFPDTAEPSLVPHRSFVNQMTLI